MSRPTPSVAALRSRLALLQQVGLACAPAAPPVSLGVADVDARIDGGLTRAALHELFAAGLADVSALAGFAILLAVRAQIGTKPVIWVREDRGDRNNGRLYAQGLVDLGADPDRFMIVHAPEPWGKARELDLTASRRLSMAAARSGVMTLLLRSGADPGPSAALTRWRIGCAPSRLLEEDEGGAMSTEWDEYASGSPVFDIEMLRHRGGLPSFTARLEWNRDRSSFETPLFGDLSAVSALGTDPYGGSRAA
jgi:protein ImuA